MRSRNKYDVFNWVMRIANSADTAEQKESAHNLLDNFKKQFNIDSQTDCDMDMIIFIRQFELCS